MSKALVDEIHRMKEYFKVKDNEVNNRVKSERKGNQILYYVDGEVKVVGKFKIVTVDESREIEICTDVIRCYE